MSNNWKDPGIVILAAGTVLSLAVSAFPTFVALSLVHSLPSDGLGYNWWGFGLTVFALVVFEGSAVTSKALSIWIPEWETGLTVFMVVMLVLTGTANGVHGWSILKSLELEGIYKSIQQDPVASSFLVFSMAVIFPAFQGLFSHAFTMRWKMVYTEMKEIEKLRKEIEEWIKNHSEIFQLFQQKEKEVEMLKNQQIIQNLELEVAKRQFTLERMTLMFNNYLSQEGMKPISQSAVYRMIIKDGE